ncbi:hypothetical protein GMOD_00000338 [Pyrenophora seminiperda CCB06]|uniref:Uncharacterized protein n=1 Tax=Pyrenophora seminiperda CCB06 TaxID=1302712 RepID=A0A3M7M6Y9_9PLEO|nr:hypothetical protein GMOD_00000338 [Pyrenophora seminiperda CCB06]
MAKPPANELPEATTTTPSTSRSANDDDIDAQFQEPIPAQPSTSTSNSNSAALHKTTTEKLKDVVKKPFGEPDQGSHTLGNKEITSPEMAAANEVLTAKDLKSP